MSLPRVLFLVHGGPASIERVRADELAVALPPGHARVVTRPPGAAAAIRAWQAAVREFRPDLVHILNTAFPGALLGPWWAETRGLPYLLDTGDAVFEMARRSGVGSGPRLPILWAAEQLAQRRAAAVVVRGSEHREYLRQQGLTRVHVLPDGYRDPGPVDPAEVDALRRSLGLAGRLVVGVMGSTVHSPRLDICYGWDLLEALSDLGDLPVTGVVIGDGPGLPWLRQRARELGVEDRVIFTGRIPYAEVPRHLRLFDVALSTQTNNLPGRVRTTGKLPEYMAAGCHILASRVGEAARVLPNEMLVPFHGEVDRGYPARLADRIRQLCREPARLEFRRTLPARAAELFGYDRLRTRWRAVVDAALGDSGS